MENGLLLSVRNVHIYPTLSARYYVHRLKSEVHKFSINPEGIQNSGRHKTDTEQVHTEDPLLLDATLQELVATAI